MADRMCSVCGTQFRPSSSTNPSYYCGQRCYGIARSKIRSPKRPLGRFLREQWIASHLSKAAFERSIGLSRGVLANLLDDRLPTDATLQKVRAVYGDALPETESATDWRKRRGRELLDAHRDQRSPEVRRKNSEALRGRPKSPEHVARIVATKRATGVYERIGKQFAEWRATPQGRAIHRLGAHLRKTPTPTRATLRRWMMQAAAQFSTTPDQIGDWWRPALERRGLPPKRRGGPRPLEHRHEIIDAVDTEYQRSKTGDRTTAAWEAIRQRIEEIEDADVDVPTLQAWWGMHPSHCARPFGDLNNSGNRASA